jgi:hypothetical protein
MQDGFSLADVIRRGALLLNTPSRQARAAPGKGKFRGAAPAFAQTTLPHRRSRARQRSFQTMLAATSSRTGVWDTHLATSLLPGVLTPGVQSESVAEGECPPFRSGGHERLGLASMSPGRSGDTALAAEACRSWPLARVSCAGRLRLWPAPFGRMVFGTPTHPAPNFKPEGCRRARRGYVGDVCAPGSSQGVTSSALLRSPKFREPPGFFAREGA